MAYAALVSFAHTLDQFLSRDRNSNSYNEKQLSISVQKDTILLLEFLEDFPERAQSLEGRIRDVAYEAEDTIEFLMCKQCVNCFPELTILAEKFGSITGQVKKMKSRSRIKDDQQLSDSTSAISSSRIAPTVLIGLDDDLIAIKDRLCGESSHLQIVPIIGMGGIGKTTLARNAFDDPLSREYFHIRVWVTVSQDYCAQEILSGLLVSIEKLNTEKSAQRNGTVEERVYKSLKGRRYLIVMDDMWCEKAWDDLKQVFPDDGNGSRIILTSRLSVVAAYPDPCTSLYEMQLMSADQSWDLLRHKVFGHEDCPSELENIGKKIATSCRGLPLAIVVIAGVLSMVSKTPSSWEEIAEHVNSTIAARDGHVEKILSLSYYHLPHHLRPCFLYMGGFPEDYEIRVSKLVKIWVAEGFLRRQNESKSLEEEAEQYLEDLVKRSLIFATKKKSNGKIKSCTVHDLVRDLCIRIAQEEKFLLIAGKNLPKKLVNQRRISVAHSTKDCLADTNGSRIHTIECFHCEGMIAGSLGNFKLLRVLVAEYTRFMMLNDESIDFDHQVSKLFQLRYLDVYRENYISTAIPVLQNLQTLIIHAWKADRDYPGSRVSLSSGIWRMPKLRHLICYFLGDFPYPKEDGPALENLQTLSLVTNFICTKTVSQKIPNLKKLGICYYRCEGGLEFQLENLVYLRQLEKLKIKVYIYFPYPQKLNPVFPSSLKKLTLSGQRLPWESLTVIGSLPNLEVLKLRDFACIGREWETNLGEFTKLIYLLIDKSNLQQWITESSHFPRLKSLLLRRCWCLTEIPNDIGDIPTLELIDVDNGNKSLVESAKRIQEEQQSWGNDGLQVRWTPS